MKHIDEYPIAEHSRIKKYTLKKLTSMYNRTMIQEFSFLILLHILVNLRPEVKTSPGGPTYQTIQPP